MASGFDPGALLGASFPLADGTRVRLRLARWTDSAMIDRLFAEAGAGEDGLVGRLVQFDPRERVVLCAMALIDGSETLVGVGALDVAGAGVEPGLVVARPEMEADLRELLTSALRGRAEALIRARAA